MTQNSQTTQFFLIKPSRQLKMGLDFLHGAAAVSCWLTSLAMSYQLLLSMAVGVFWLISNKCCKTPTYHLRYTATGGWEVAFEGADYLAIIILGSTVVTPWGIFLHYKAHKQPGRSLVIAKDSLSADNFRRLLVRLKLSGYEQGR